MIADASWTAGTRHDLLQGANSIWFASREEGRADSERFLIQWAFVHVVVTQLWRDDPVITPGQADLPRHSVSGQRKPA